MNKKEFNITEWLNKKPDTTNQKNTDQEKSAQIREIRGGKNMISVNSCQFVDQGESVSPSSVDCCPLSVDLQQEIELLTMEIENRAIDIAPDYQSWRDLGFALADALGENGRDYYHRLSRFYPNYSYEETDKQFTACLNAHGNGITSKTIFHLAKQAGITIAPLTPITPISPISPISPNEETRDFGETEEIELMPTFSQDVKDTLPGFLRKIVGMSTSPEEADLLILGAITVFSSSLPNVYGNYDGREVYPNLFLFIAAQASAGKGKLSLCRHLVQPIHDNLRLHYLAEMEEYKQLLNEYTLDKNNHQQPQEPILKTLFIPANSSATSVYQMLNDNGGQGLLFETEGDTLAIAFKSDYGNYSDGFRKAFHHEMISYMRRKDREYVEISKPRLSTLLSGTPRQILSLVPDTENGLFSRFIFYYMNTRIEWKNVFASKEQTLDNAFVTFGHDFHNLYKYLLLLEQPVRFAFSPKQEEQFNQFFEQIQDEYSSIFGFEIVASIRRFGLITYRLAMIMTILAVNDGTGLYPLMVCTDDIFNSAMTIIKTLLKHTLKVFEILPMNNDNILSAPQTAIKNVFFDSLPKRFNRQTYISIAAGLNMNPKKADKYIYNFVKTNKINRLEHDNYCKL